MTQLLHLGPRHSRSSNFSVLSFSEKFPSTESRSFAYLSKQNINRSFTVSFSNGRTIWFVDFTLASVSDLIGRSCCFLAYNWLFAGSPCTPTFFKCAVFFWFWHDSSAWNALLASDDFFFSALPRSTGKWNIWDDFLSVGVIKVALITRWLFSKASTLQSLPSLKPSVLRTLRCDLI